MNDKFKKEKDVVLEAARKGITGNLKLSGSQKKYVKNLLLFALMNASSNDTVTNKNFIKLVNRLFKGFLLKILKESLDDDDDEDWESALEVELNKIIASDALLKNTDLQMVFTPEKIFEFLKNNTNGLSQKEILRRLASLREVKANYRETPKEREKRERNKREYELAKTRQRMMERELNQREYEQAETRQRMMERAGRERD